MRIDRAPAFASAALFGSVALAALAAQAERASVAPSVKVALPAAVSSLSGLNGSSRVAAGMADGTIAVWDGRSTQPGLTLKPHDTRVLAVGSAADGREVWSVAEGGSLARTAVAAGASSDVKTLAIGTSAIRAAAFSPDGSLLATGGEYGEIHVFATATAKMVQKIQGHRTEMHYLALRSGNPVLASASAEADLRIWDASTGRELGSIDSDLAFFALAFSPRDGMLASGGVGRQLTFHDPRTFKPAGSMTLPRPRMVSTLAWSPDGLTIAVGDLDDESLSKGSIQLVDPKTRATLADLDTGGVPPTALVFAAADTVVAALGRELRAWTVAASPRR